MKEQLPDGSIQNEYLQTAIKYVTPAYHCYTDIVVRRAQGSYVYDTDDKAYLDLTCGIGVTSLGHAHPKILEAVHKQVDNLIHVSDVTRHENYIALAKKVVEVSPKGLSKVFFSNSGSEVVDGAIKLARRLSGRTDILAFKGGFHGRTYGALSLTTSKEDYRQGYAPLLPGIHFVDYPKPYACGGEDNAMEKLVQQIESLRFNINPGAIAAVIVEPILGEGGYIVPPRKFLPYLREFCNQHGILLIADEVQSGIARTGKMFAVEHWDVSPDILLCAKALGSGFPLSAIIGTDSLMSAWTSGAHGTTFGGNPVACASALAGFEVIEEDGLIERAATVGQTTIDRLKTNLKDVAGVAEVRGLGMMIGIEFSDTAKYKAGDRQEAVRAKRLEKSVIVISCGSKDEVIRLLPPLNIAEQDLEKGLLILEQAIKETA